MRPVAIFRHFVTEGPGYFATHLDRRGLPWKLIKLDEGEAVPANTDPFGGLAFMGGPMSVNDDLAWIPPVLALIREAVARDVPVLGHCLGGQLMAKALGGRVSPAPVKEIGWGEVKLDDEPAAAAWLGPECTGFLSFHWHGETFTLPPGASRLLSSPWCPNQAFTLGNHLALQCHIEMTEELVRVWCKTGAREIERSSGPGVQSVDQILTDLEPRLAALHRVADRVYGRWSQALKS
ncbi:MAG TPA: type 1 glutamine amidotransferase [Burkholderiales bacterium]|nr:type 1 glutamine amidotransferase [Burkholderiales bacterium]